MLLSWLAEYGEVQSELVEDVFDDSEDSEGENVTGTYETISWTPNDFMYNYYSLIAVPLFIKL